MELTPEQQLAIHHGAAVPFVVANTECVIVRKDVYEQSLQDSQSETRATYATVLKAWDAEDEDPAQYREYLRGQ